MWPKRKPANRRNDREAVLEVRMRSRDARRARFRLLTALVTALGATAVGALLVWQAYQWSLERFVYRNEAYTLRRVELRHHGRLRPELIHRWVGVQPGQNLLALDLDRIRHDLELNPWIERADVEAERPDCLRLAVWERQPRAQVVVWRQNPATGHTWAETNLVDAHGMVFPLVPADWIRPGEESDFSHLPRISGLDPTQVASGEPLRQPRVPAALGLIEAYGRSPVFSVVNLDEIDVSRPGVLVGALREGNRVIFGLEEFDRQLWRWRSIHDYLTAQGDTFESLDLSVTNNLPARLRPRPEPSPSPSPARPQRTKTPHV